jgi:hypothetical protein
LWLDQLSSELGRILGHYSHVLRERFGD